MGCLQVAKAKQAAVRPLLAPLAPPKEEPAEQTPGSPLTQDGGSTLSESTLHGMEDSWPPQGETCSHLQCQDKDCIVIRIWSLAYCKKE